LERLLLGDDQACFHSLEEKQTPSHKKGD